MAPSEKCQYKDESYDFTCDEPPICQGSKFCIFHDINYLKGDNYEKNKEEVAKRFEEKLGEYSSNHSPLRFIGYHLPDVSFQGKLLTEELDFNGATFYGRADFNGVTFPKGASFGEATFSGEANFGSAIFSGATRFGSAIFSEVALSFSYILRPSILWFS